MKKILYIMGIDWNWIYQRPQILAEMLNKDYDVTILFPRSVLKIGKKEKNIYPIKYRILWTLPFQEKNKLIGKVAYLINRKIFRDIKTFDMLYIGYPLYGRYIPKDYNGKIIYDCMDNHEALYPDKKRVDKVTIQEKKLIERSNLVLASSESLRKKIETVGHKKNVILIRNGVKIVEIGVIKKAQVRKEYCICYIGTIAEWFDYDILIKSLNKITGIQYYLIGPCRKQVQCSGINYEGAVEHEKLAEVINEYDCLIMPFCKNEVVLSVDPVKLYEYVAFGKCIISVYYEEIERFSDFVYFYRNFDEYEKLLENLKKLGFPPKYNEEQQKKFLSENTWENRYKLLKTEMKAMEVQNEY